MVRLKPFLVVAQLCLAICFSGTTALAQGLVLNLPEDRVSVEYEGTLTQATSVDDQSPLSWNCELTIKSVGREDAVFEGKVQPCRWVEIKTLTGKAGAAGIDPGPDPETALQSARAVALIRRELQALPARLREPLILCAIEGLSQDAAAELLGVSRKAIETRIYRARQKLSALLEG